jgi:hypothetical protein
MEAEQVDTEQEERAKIVSSVAAAVMNDEPIPTPEDIGGTPGEPESRTAETRNGDGGKADPWRTELESKLKSFETVAYRLEQAEKRIGALDAKRVQLEKELQETKAKKVEPTPEQTEEAKKSKDAWEWFKESAPEEASAIEGQLKELTGKMPKPEALIEMLRPSLKAEILSEIAGNGNGVTKEDLIETVHRGWLEEVKTPQFKSFLDSRPELLPKVNSPRVADAIAVLDEFKATKSPGKTAAGIAAEQKARLKASATDASVSKAKREKPIDDMTEAEIRQMVARKVFAKT